MLKPSQQVFDDKIFRATAPILDVRWAFTKIAALNTLRPETWEDDGHGCGPGVCVRLPKGPVISIAQSGRDPTMTTVWTDEAEFKKYGRDFLVTRVLRALDLGPEDVSFVPGDRGETLKGKAARDVARAAFQRRLG